jgi:hypothetical protein
MVIAPLPWFDLEHHAGVCLPSERGCPVEVAVRAKYHACVGSGAIRSASEAAEHGLIAGRIDVVKDHTVARCAAEDRSPIEKGRAKREFALCTLVLE